MYITYKFKKLIILGIFIGCFTTVVFVTFKKDKIYTYEELEVIKSTRIKNQKILQNVKVNNINSPYDTETNNYFFSAKEDKDLKIILETNSNTNQSINKLEKNNEYLITVFNDDYYFETTLTVVALPLVNISTGAKAKKNFGIERDDEEMVSFELIDCNYMEHESQGEFYSSLATMRIRGAYTKRFPKKGYKIVLENNSSLLGMRYDDDWALDALYSDNTKIRNALASDLWNVMNDNQEINNDLNAEFVEVFVDNQYYGLYVLKELADKKTTQLTGDGLLLQVRYGISDATRDRMKNKDFEVINNRIFNWEIKNNASTEIINSFASIYSEYVLSENKDESLNKYFDKDSYINTRLLIMLIDGWDNVTNNLFLSKKDFDSKILTTPWDMDSSLGGAFLHNGVWTSKAPYNGDITINNLMEDAPITNNEIKLRWKELRSNVLFDNLIDLYIDNYKKTIVLTGAVDRDSKMWDSKNVENDIEYVRGWIHKRLAFLDEYFK